MKNPFVTNGYAGPEYFCDRVEETQHITEMLTNENNMALIWRKRSIPTHSGWLYPLTFDAGKGLKEA